MKKSLTVLSVSVTALLIFSVGIGLGIKKAMDETVVETVSQESDVASSVASDGNVDGKSSENFGYMEPLGEIAITEASSSRTFLTFVIAAAIFLVVALTVVVIVFAGFFRQR